MVEMVDMEEGWKVILCTCNWNIPKHKNLI
jgi:hypothetical protein